MKKRKFGIAIAIVAILGIGIVLYNQIIPNEYIPTDVFVNKKVLQKGSKKESTFNTQ